jgi:hypothetical protein
MHLETATASVVVDVDVDMTLRQDAEDNKAD